MNKSQEVYFNTGSTSNNKHIKVLLEQDTDSLEFLTMSINTKEIYRSFNSDYGVLVGRVVANENVGVPNAKVSIFIPLSSEDSNDSDISSIYPYKTPRDKNLEGKRYNLLPRVSKINPNTNLVTPKQAFGSFPIKEEIVSNVKYLDVYRKYYKYTTVTNYAGDYMIFGVPIGTQIVHMSVDITDIGEYSMNPASMVTNLGYSPNLFTENNTKIKESSDINNLPHIETQEITVDVIPFWGDAVNFEIGITRQDFKIRGTLNKTFVIFGNVFTDGNNSMWGANYLNGPRIGELYRIRNNGDVNLNISSKRIGNITEKIYYYPADISDEDIDNGTAGAENMKLLDRSNYSIYKRDGDFIFIISCNRNKIIKTNNGAEVQVPFDTFGGIYNEFRGFITLEITPEDLPMNFTDLLGDNSDEIYPFRFKIKIPQSALRNSGFGAPYPSNTLNNDNWRNQHTKFTGGKFYSIAKFNGVVHNDLDNYLGIHSDGFLSDDTINTYVSGLDPFNMTGIITTSSNNTVDSIPTNINKTTFGGNWLNFSVYLPQMGFLANGPSFSQDVMRVNTNFTNNLNNVYYNEDNEQIIAGTETNTKWFSRSDLHYTDFINVPTDDIIMFLNIPEKGMTLTDGFIGTEYKNGETDLNFPYIGKGGKVNIETNVVDKNYYFYKGIKESNCIQYLRDLNLI
jgi:hypothetical protein